MKKRLIILLAITGFAVICEAQQTQLALNDDMTSYIRKHLLKNLYIAQLANSTKNWESSILSGRGDANEMEFFDGIILDYGVMPQMVISKCDLSYPNPEYLLYIAEIPACRFNDSLANNYKKVLSSGKVSKGLFPFYGKYLIAVNKSNDIKFINSTSMMLLDNIVNDFISNGPDTKKVQHFLETYFYFSLKNISYLNTEKDWYVYKCYNEVLKKEDTILVNPKNPYQKKWGKI